MKLLQHRREFVIQSEFSFWTLDGGLAPKMEATLSPVHETLEI